MRAVEKINKNDNKIRLKNSVCQKKYCFMLKINDFFKKKVDFLLKGAKICQRKRVSMSKRAWLFYFCLPRSYLQHIFLQIAGLRRFSARGEAFSFFSSQKIFF